MRKIRNIYVPLQIVLAAVLLSSCDDYFNCLDGNGIPGSEERLVSANFTAVENTTSFDVEVIHDTEFRVVVKADENLLPYINTRVHHGTLLIDMENNRCLNSSNPIIVEVQMPYIDGIESTGSGSMLVFDFKSEDMKVVSTGSGDIIASNFECTSIDIANSGSGTINFTDVFSTSDANVTLTGSGDVILTGQADETIILLTGSGTIMTDEFPVNKSTINNSGSGDVYCNVQQQLSVVLTGSGDVIYSGSPSIKQIITGSGRVLPN